MRAVSLVSGVVAGADGEAGAGGRAAAGAAGPAVVPIGRGKGVFATDGGAGGTAFGGGGANVRGVGTEAAGGLGKGTCETGGRGTGTLPGFGTRGTDVGGGSDVGGRAGRLIRTVSSSAGTAASPRRGGRVIRVVSFLGSSASAMVTESRWDYQIARKCLPCHWRINGSTIKRIVLWRVAEWATTEKLNVGEDNGRTILRVSSRTAQITPVRPGLRGRATRRGVSPANCVTRYRRRALACARDDSNVGWAVECGSIATPPDHIRGCRGFSA